MRVTFLLNVREKMRDQSKLINLYLTVFIFFKTKRKENMWKCKINLICGKLKNTMRKKIKNILINIFILHYI